MSAEPTRHAADYDQWFEQPWGRYAFGVESAAIIRAAGNDSCALVLDAGCGTGRFSSLIADQSARAVGVDLDAGMLDIATHRLGGRCVRASVDALPFPDNTFDASLAVTVLEFVTQPAAALAEMARVTRRGGRIIVGTLNPHSPWGVINRRRLRAGDWCDANFLERRELRMLGAPHGHAKLHAALYAPRCFPGLAAVSPLLEALGRLVPWWGAFQVLAVAKR